MKRRVLTILLFLLLGAVISIAVAWWNALLYSDLKLVALSEINDDDRAVHVWNKVRKDDWPLRPQTMTSFKVSGAALTAAYTEEPGLECYYWASEMRYGLPLPCMSFTFWSTPTDGGNYAHVLPPKEVVSPVLVDAGLTLPTKALWLALGVDSVFWAGAMALLRAIYRRQRGDRRMRRGRCPRCGYHLRGELSAGCPECGWNREEAKA